MANLLRLSACLFVLLSLNAFAVDTDGDGFSDADEATLGTDPNDPTSPLENKLTASDARANDWFGTGVAIDGDTAVIGASGGSGNHAASGSAYVYVLSDGVWSEQAKLTASDGGNGDAFGYSVSIDGDTVVVGAEADDDNGFNSGSAYVFLRSGGVWTEQQKLTPSDININNNDSVPDSFGYSVSIDGDTVLISAHRISQPAVYVYIRNNSIWTEEAKLTPSDLDYPYQFGPIVSIDGNTAVVGAAEGTYSSGGSAYVFVRSNGVWNEQAKLTPGDADLNVVPTVSIDGNTVVLGDRSGAGNDNDSGSAYVFVRNNAVWSEQQKLTASDGAQYDGFGSMVSIDGDTTVIGAYERFSWGSGTGSAYVYVRNNNVWTEQAKLTAIHGAADDKFGWSVSIDGDTAVISAPNNDDNGIYPYKSGSAYVFPLSFPHQDTPASITGATSANVNIGGFGFGTLIATDVDGLTDGSYFTISTPPVNGQALINAATGNWIYTANNSYTGPDPFTVTVTDDLGGTTEQVVSITITAPDSDGDGAYDHQDNCPSVSNADQANFDDDAFGDACDSDIDGDGVDNTLDAFPNDPTESSDSDSDNVGDNADNCVNAANFEQSDIDSDTLGDACDADMDGDGYANVFEVRFGGDETDNTDAAVSLANAVAFSETAPADSDLDGVPDDIETAAGDDTTTSTLQSVIDALSINKQVPAMGGIGLLALGLSMLGLGAVRSRRRH